MEFLKKNWWIIGAVGFLIAFGSRLSAIASAPQAAQKTAETVDKLAESLNTYVASNEEQKKFIQWRIEQLEKK